MARPLALITEELDDACTAWLRDHCDVAHVPFDDPAFDASLAKADALIVRTYTQVNDALLDKAPNLKAVGRAGVGLDNIDVPACRSRGVEVVHTPDANTSAVTELVFAFILDALRPRVFLDRPLPMPEWKALRTELTAHRQLRECTLGIVGLGRVGKSIARIAHAFAMPTIYHDLIDIPDADRESAAPVDPDTLFATADILTVHIDNRPANRHHINSGRLALMKPDALLINASRGFVADASAIADWLTANPNARAIADVHDPEPITSGNPLLNLPNAHLTPHIGAATRLAHRNMSWVVRDIVRTLAGEPPEFPAP